MKREWLRRLFPDYEELRGQGKCPVCKRVIEWNEFVDDLSLKEFEDSGLCQNCQEEVFGE